MIYFSQLNAFIFKNKFDYFTKYTITISNNIKEIEFFNRKT